MGHAKEQLKAASIGSGKNSQAVVFERGSGSNAEGTQRERDNSGNMPRSGTKPLGLALGPIGQTFDHQPQRNQVQLA